MKNKYLSLGILVLALMIGAVLLNLRLAITEGGGEVSLVVPWHGMGAQLVEYGVIDEAKFRSLYPNRQDLVDLVLSSDIDRRLVMDRANSDVLLNALWAFGLANKNKILEEGPMMDPRYGGVDRFASTGGWRLGQKNAMTYYSQFPFVVLTAGEQALVEKVSKNVYRPCCANPAYFPDCNHGMAMLGLLELLAADGADEAALYKAAEQANAFWFGPVAGGSC